MKHRLALIITFSLILFIMFMQFEQNLSKANESVRIPDKAIRLRILANSNSANDQAVKRQIRDAVNANINGWVKNLKSFDQAKHVIRSHMDDINTTVQHQLDDMHLHENFTVKLGPAKFPTKMYGGYVYPAGTYDALVITLGKGEGANWWCVLFPPLCFLDFSHGDAVKPDHQGNHLSKTADSHLQDQKNNKDVKVKFFIVDWIESLVQAVKGMFS
ncbi:stage II sporulation protein R [Scopulibacillus daqui]|nr:stage II sporulation protein R [Scopulibacillus daqui]